MGVHIDIRELTKGVHLGGFPDIKDFDLSKTGLNATGKDALGRYYFMDVELQSALLGKSFRLPNEPLVRVVKQKNLVKTTISGNDSAAGGVVIEQVNAGNYQIDIRGVILNEDPYTPQYPQDAVEQLIEFCESAEALTVECDLLENIFKVRKLIIEEFTIDPMPGRPYSQSYALSCFSYEDFLASRKLTDL
ncbi:MAG: hypothetical protein H6606_06060 [Flavobacteriales bacterium]|nr:hypothetical protein [Flavobacteriales bacterium]